MMYSAVIWISRVWDRIVRWDFRPDGSAGPTPSSSGPSSR